VTRPAIPVCLAHRPVIGGLAAPYITVEHRDGTATLGAVHSRRVDECLVKRLCQACGRPLGTRAVVFVRQTDIDHGYSAEPALHPECAAYSSRACPVLAGTMTRYRSAPRNITDKRCPDPGCDCAGWVEDDDQVRAGRTVEPYYALWMRLGDYGLAADERGAPIGVALPQQPLKIRPVNPQAVELQRAVEASAAALRLLTGGTAPRK